MMHFYCRIVCSKKPLPSGCQNCITVSGIFTQSPVENAGNCKQFQQVGMLIPTFSRQGLVDRYAAFKQGLRGRLKFFRQGPIKIFHAESAEKILIKVRLKIFRQGLMQFSRTSTRRSGTHARTFQSRSVYFFSCKVCSKLFNQGPVENFHAGSDAIFPHVHTSQRHTRTHISIKV